MTLVADVRSDPIPRPAAPTATGWRPPPGEGAARVAVNRFLDGRVADYRRDRDQPASDATSRLGPYLKFGCLHPRQLLHRLDLDVPGEELFAKQLAWRDFYADVLHAWPESAWRASIPHSPTSEPTPASLPTSASLHGALAAPASRSSMPGCASSWPRGSCTIGCG